MRIPLPSKKILPFLIACIFTLGILVYASVVQKTNKDTPAEETTPVNLVAKQILSDKGTTDSDNDGLKDWEEVLWKTDPTKSDTDNDGVSDAEEVLQGRSPTEEGVGGAAATSTATSSRMATRTATDELSIGFFNEYLDLKMSGIPITGQWQQILSTGFSNQAVNAEVTYTTYTAKNLKVSGDTSMSALLSYGKKIRESILTPSDTKLENELLIFEESAQGNEEAIKKLDPIIEYYRTVTAQMLAIPVPQSALTIHIELVNRFGAMKTMLENMRKLHTDTLAAITAFSDYDSNSFQLTASIENAVAFFKQHNIDL